MQDLLNASPGLNLGVDFLPGAFGFDGDAARSGAVDGRARCCGSTRSAPTSTARWRNPNLLLWHGDLWVIDHGAALYFHHGWAGGVGDPERFAAQPWDAGRPRARARTRGGLRRRRRGAQRGCSTSRRCAEVSAQVPDAWLEPVPGAETPDALRAAYVAFLAARLGTRQWLPGRRWRA